MDVMTPEDAAALRKPFPASAIGRLPKAGVQLDYVGHAATTDRLLSVDPDWSWEPFATDENGLPALDRKNNLWIRLTVCGTTRIGVGDGSSAKEVIGDAIRNAAMRFGVALDLWSKEELEQAHAPAGRPSAPVDDAPAPDAPAPATRTMSRPRPAQGDDDGITKAQSAALHASFNGAGVTDRDTRLDYCRNLIGRHIGTSNDLTLTKAEASKILEALRQDADEAVAREP